MKMDIQDRPDGLVAVALVGRLDSPGVEAVELGLTAQTVPRGARTIVDLSGVEFVGSMAIRMFITLARSLARNKGRLVLHSPQPLVDQVFETASLHDILAIEPDAASAAAAALR
jgi:anti-sigma B factor antagonist